MIRALPHIADMAPYALAEMVPPPGRSLISLAQNESLRPPCPGALEAARLALTESARYPDPDWTRLRTALADLHGLSAQNILCGGGSLELIGAIARVFAGPDRAVLSPVHGYPFFRTAARMAGARFDTAPEQHATVAVDALLGAVRPDTAVVFVANPGNPTGTRIPSAELRRVRAELHEDILLVIDEAYGEFSDPLDARVFDMAQETTTIVLRSFSKAYGMAGFRVGWGCFPPDIATEIRKVLNPNNVSMASQAAAIAAVHDQDYMRETCDLTAKHRDFAARRLGAAGFHVHRSHTNFLLIDLGSRETAKAADAALRAEGIFLRPQASTGLAHTLRMTIGPEEAMDAALGHLKHWRKETP